jgi:hypothetical protein
MAFSFRQTRIIKQTTMQLTTPTSTEAVRGTRSRMTALRTLPLMAVLSVFLLFAQAVEHGHSHDADLQAQFDCEICLKIGSLDNIAVAEAPQLIAPATGQQFSILIQNQISSDVLSATARAPPSYT